MNTQVGSQDTLTLLPVTLGLIIWDTPRIFAAAFLSTRPPGDPRATCVAFSPACIGC